jgi:hypothetical protein
LKQVVAVVVAVMVVTMVFVSGAVTAEASNPFASFQAKTSPLLTPAVNDPDETSLGVDTNPFANYYAQHSPDRPREEIVPIIKTIKFYFGSWFE